jgi:hypothetical protein
MLLISAGETVQKRPLTDEKNLNLVVERARESGAKGRKAETSFPTEKTSFCTRSAQAFHTKYTAAENKKLRI